MFKNIHLYAVYKRFIKHYNTERKEIKGYRKDTLDKY